LLGRKKFNVETRPNWRLTLTGWALQQATGWPRSQTTGIQKENFANNVILRTYDEYEHIKMEILLLINWNGQLKSIHHTEE
jgi:hypothetical protein